MAKQLSKKSVILGLASLTIAGLAYVVNVKKNEQKLINTWMNIKKKLIRSLRARSASDSKKKTIKGQNS